MEIPPGYYFYPSIYNPELGHPQLDIAITSSPQQRFYDTHRVLFPVAGASGVQLISISHPWTSFEGPDIFRICAGSFHMYEADGEEHSGFCMGGELRIQVTDAFTFCSLISTAPIFELMDDPDAAVEMFVDELEILIAKRQTFWGEEENIFAEKLEKVDPLLLFSSCVLTLESEIKRIPSASRQAGRYPEVLHTLANARLSLQNVEAWPIEVPNLIDLI